jgi:hypothetical protein
MSVNRRKFLQQAALAAAASAATPLLSWGQRRPEVDNPELEIGPGAAGGHGFASAHLGVSRTAFENLVGSSFKASSRTGNSNPVWMRLSSVDELPSLAPVNPASMAVPPKNPTSPVPTTSGYMLAFSAPGTSLAQDTYIIENAQMGQFDLFIVPGTLGTYTAVFNLLNPVHNGRIIITSHENGSPAPAANTHGKGLGSEHPAGSTAGSPAQELMEPALRNGFKAKLPE